MSIAVEGSWMALIREWHHTRIPQGTPWLYSNSKRKQDLNGIISGKLSPRERESRNRKVWSVTLS